MKKLGQKGFTLVEGLLSVITLVLVFGAGYYVYNANHTQAKASSAKTSSKPAQISKKQTGDTYKDGPGADWRTYINYDAGFSIQIPKKFLSGYGSSCTKSNDSYRPASGVVPTIVINENPNFSITEAYTYQLTQPSQQLDDTINFAGCKKLTTTAKVLKDYEKGGGVDAPQLMVIPITIATVKSQSDITPAAKSLINKYVSVSSLQKGKGDWQDVKLTCSTDYCLDYSFQLRYYEKQHKLVYIVQGQSGKLQHTGDNGYYDQDVINSFKLLN